MNQSLSAIPPRTTIFLGYRCHTGDHYLLLLVGSAPAMERWGSNFPAASPMSFSSSGTVMAADEGRRDFLFQKNIFNYRKRRECAAPCSRPRIIASSPANCCAHHGAQVFSAPPELSSRWLVARMRCHEGVHLLSRRVLIGQPSRPRHAPPVEEQASVTPDIGASSGTFSPRSAHQPLHEAANCIFNRYTYL